MSNSARENAESLGIPLLFLFFDNGSKTLIPIMGVPHENCPMLARLCVAAHDARFAVLAVESHVLPVDTSQKRGRELFDKIVATSALDPASVPELENALEVLMLLAAQRDGTEKTLFYQIRRKDPICAPLIDWSPNPEEGALMLQMTFAPLYLLPEVVMHSRLSERIARERLQLTAAAQLKVWGIRQEPIT